MLSTSAVLSLGNAGVSATKMVRRPPPVAASSSSSMSTGMSSTMPDCALGDADGAVVVDLDGGVDGRRLGEGEQAVQLGGGVVVVEGERVLVGVGALVDGEHAGHLLRRERDLLGAVAQRDRPREVRRRGRGARLGVDRAHLRRHDLRRDRAGVAAPGSHGAEDGALERDGVDLAPVLRRHDGDALRR